MASPSSIQRRPVDAADAAAQLRADDVLEIGYLLRKVLDTRTQYAPDHPNTRAANTKFYERVNPLLGPAATLTFTVAARELFVGQHPLNKNTEADPLAQSLFGEGARKIVFSRGLTTQQLGAFFEIAARRRASHSDQSLMTEFWEAELPNIQFVVATTFADDASAGSLDIGSTQAKKSELVGSLMSVFCSSDMTAAAGSTELPAMISMSQTELSVLASSDLSGIDQSDLKKHDAAGRTTLLTLEAATLASLRERLSQPRVEAAERLLASHFEAAITAPADLKPKVMASLQQLLELLLASNRFEPCARAIDQQLQAAKSDPGIAAQRLPLLNQMRQSLVGSTLVKHLILGLDDEKQAPHAILLLRIFGSYALDQVFDSIAMLKGEHGKQNLSRLLGLMNIKPEVLAARAKAPTPEVAREIVLLVNKLQPAVGTPVLSILLQNTDGNIRRVVVRALDKTGGLSTSPLLRKMLGDPDRDVRMAVVRLLAYAEDSASVEAMNLLLRRASTDTIERREVYRALGEIGGSSAADVLTDELNRLTDADAKILLLGLFNRAWSPKADKAIGELSAKLLTLPRLRQACKAALARGEAAGALYVASTSGIFKPGAPVK